MGALLERGWTLGGPKAEVRGGGRGGGGGGLIVVVGGGGGVHKVFQPHCISCYTLSVPLLPSVAIDTAPPHHPDLTPTA